MTWKEKIKKHAKHLADALVAYEADHPEWRLESLLWIAERCLRNLKRLLDDPAQSSISWAHPFVEMHFPVDCDWKTTEAGVSFSLHAGALTKENLKDEDTAVTTLTEIMIRQLEIVTMQHATGNSAYGYENGSYRPMLSPETIDHLEGLESDEARSEELRSVLQPCSFGAGTIQFPADMQPGDIMPPWVKMQLAKVKPPLVMIPMPAGKEGTDVAVIFEVHPLVINFDTKKAYFPLTIGLTIFTEPVNIQDNPSPGWVQFATWTQEEKENLWESLYAAIAQQLREMGPAKPAAIEKAVVVVNATMQMEQAAGESVDDLRKRALKELEEVGTILRFDSHLQLGLQAGPELKALSALETVEAAKTNEEKGQSLEALMRILFESIEGLSVSKRAKTQTEEIDLFIVNLGDVPMFRHEGNVILVECKNQKQKSGKEDFVLFRSKMENRGERCTLGFLISWNGFASTFTREMLRSSKEKLLVVPINGEQIKAAVEINKFQECLQECWKKALSI